MARIQNDHHARLIDYLGYDAFKLTGLKDPYGNEPQVVAFFSQPIMLKVQPVRVRRWKMTMNHLDITDLGDKGRPGPSKLGSKSPDRSRASK